MLGLTATLILDGCGGPCCLCVAGWLLRVVVRCATRIRLRFRFRHEGGIIALPHERATRRGMATPGLRERGPPK